ncbi:MAG: U32 family peptidase [Clostridia bacterium]|nr:U32 family peptidase [Clostridia bacterium]
MKYFELLAPAGSYEAFLAAVENGANAVYLGGKLFNARANASNFELSELKNMVEYAHLRDVKIHVTLNTLVNNHEISDALDFAYDLYNIGVDAVIVQDLGLAKVIHENIPHLPLHASTQMSVYNLAGVEELKKLGFSRVVLARELSLKEIQYICNNTDMEIEIFVHGALCVCYSGQCLMSSMIGDRSGNRGKCAQPCRMKYELIKVDDKNNEQPIQDGYLLSPKDLCTIDYLEQLPNITSLKIEGRMKSPEYVATVVSSYRKMLDALWSTQCSTTNEYAIQFGMNEHETQLCSGAQCAPYNTSNTLKKDLLQVFNRGGFSDGYHHQKSGKDMMCYEKPKHWGIYVGKVTNYDGKRYIKIDSKNKLNIGDGIEIWNGENESPSAIISELTNGKIGRISGNIHVGDKVYKTYDKELMQKAKETYSRGFVRKQSVNVILEIKIDSPIVVKINDFIYTSEIIPEMPQKSPVTKEKIIEQFIKTGNTPFDIADLQIEMNEDIFIPISKLNELRRNAFKLYEEYYLNSIKRTQILKLPLNINDVNKNAHHYNIPKKVSLCVKYLNNDLNLILPKVDSIYVPLKEAITKEELFINLECKKYIILPTITKNKYEDLIKKNLTKLINLCNGFVVSSICQLKYFENAFDNHPYWREMLAPKLIANYTFNIFNSYTIDRLKELGFHKVILSPELTNSQINNMYSSLPAELMVYGNQCVMTSEYCPVGSIVGGFSKDKKCSMPCVKNDKYYLRDRMGVDFRVIPDNIDCQSTLYNCKITSIESKNVNVDSILINVIDEDIKEISKIIDIHKNGEKISGEKYTNAHANRPV